MQPQPQPAVHVGPFTGEDAVTDRIAQRAIGTKLVRAQHAIAMGTEALDRALRIEVAVVGV